MLNIDLGTIEFYDGESNQFHYEEIGIVNFEYSLKAMYEWEAKWRKPFLNGNYNMEELSDFYYMMSTKEFNRDALTMSVMEQLSRYIGETHTATRFAKSKSSQNGSTIGKVYTAEEIYGLMFMNHIPLEFENRNLNRLLVILRVISNYQQRKEKMSQSDIYEQNRQLNKERRQKYETKG